MYDINVYMYTTVCQIAYVINVQSLCVHCIEWLYVYYWTLLLYIHVHLVSTLTITFYALFSFLHTLEENACSEEDPEEGVYACEVCVHTCINRTETTYMYAYACEVYMHTYMYMYMYKQDYIHTHRCTCTCCWLLPSNQSFYWQIAGYRRGVGDHWVG